MDFAAALAALSRNVAGKPMFRLFGIMGFLVGLLVLLLSCPDGGVAAGAPDRALSPAKASAAKALPEVIPKDIPIDPQKVIRVGYCTGYGVIAEGKGTLTGYGYDYLQEIAKYTDWQYEFVPVTWVDGMEQLARGELDLFGPMQKTPERAERFAFPQRRMGYEYGVLYARASNESMHYEDFERFNTMRVGLVRGSFYNGAFEEYRQRNRFKVEKFLYAENKDVVEALSRGDIDVMVMPSTAAIAGVKMVARFTIEPFYFAATRGRTDIVRSLDAALDAIHTEDVYYDANLYARYFRFAQENQPAFTRAERNYLRHGRTLRMAILQDHPPLEYADENGNPRGIVFDIMTRVSRKNAIPLDFVSVASWGEALEGIRNGSIDALAGYGVIDGVVSPSALKLTSPYMNLPMVLIGRKEAVTGRKPILAVPANYAAVRDLAAQQYPDAVIGTYPSFRACLSAVQNEQADATLVSSYLFDRVTGDPEFRALHILAMVGRPLSLTVAASAEISPVALTALNKALTRLTAQDVDECVLAGTAREPVEPTFYNLITQYPREILIVLCFVAMIGTGVYMRLCRETERRLWSMAYTDNLTGYNNWYKFALDVDPVREKGSHAFVIIDIDGFKLINEYFGYVVGSRALKHMADIINDSLQPGEMAARRDGDIFCMLLHFVNEASLVARLLEIQSRIVALRLTESEEGRILHTVCGVCVDSEPRISLSSLYDRANHARKTLKPAHRNACAFYDQRLHSRLLWEQKIEQHMEQALRDGEFHVCYQPKVDLATEAVMGAEALVRWHHPQSGIIQPMAFIPLFEKNGFILKLDMLMLEQVCRHLRRWLDEGRTPVPIAVNISKVHVHTVNFVRNVREIVEQYNVPPELLELEVTESAFFDNTSALLAAMRELSATGFTLSLDDFGSGYSSLNMLKNLPVDVLKLDRDFFDMDEAEERAQLIIESVIRMAKALHMKVVSEGVETREQVDFLRRAGCDYAQGFYFFTPLTVAEFEQTIFGSAE